MEEYAIKEGIEVLKTHLKEYLNTVWKTFGAAMLAIGWVLSSKEAQQMMTNHQLIRYGAILIALLLAIAHISTLRHFYLKSQKARAALSPMISEFMASIADEYVIPRSYPIASGCINGLLYICLIGIIGFGFP